MNAVARNRRWGLLGLIVVCFLSIPLHFFMIGQEKIPLSDCLRQSTKAFGNI